MKVDRPVRLRDFIKAEGCFFSVVGYRNEERIKSFLRYVPDSSGDRELNGKRYKKLSHDEAVSSPLAKKYLNSGVFRLPYSVVEEVYKPEERLEFAMKSSEVRKIVDFFSEIPKDKMGVTGSRLIGLEGEDSDVDFIVYGNWWFRAREKLRKSIETGKLSEPDDATWGFIYRKRKIPLPYEIFILHERRKYHRAFLGSTYFDLLYVRDYDEIGRDVPEEVGIKRGKAEIEATVRDDSLVFDYPGYYPVEHPEIEAILSFTHTFVGQAFSREKILARGDVEEIDGKLYLIVGTKRETHDEFIVSLDLMEKAGLMADFERWHQGLEVLPP
ncbi:MAG: nucleotidyltransferase domain-containing protein [Archaeoglobus sp.]|uniref:nucleotidyltransferase domain-containing protein n=1 Tax=Archaeoglobus sp. TaxID=1872626 RepID=UPI001DD73F4F|nr:nucleotidyltransferase domain-containing protein [Archaeoglobus sp.]MBO8179357.1 nucleotidyltransferase domain-containing protein [Archaeoglobus sp.]